MSKISLRAFTTLFLCRKSCLRIFTPRAMPEVGRYDIHHLNATVNIIAIGLRSQGIHLINNYIVFHLYKQEFNRNLLFSTSGFSLLFFMSIFLLS